MRFEDYAKLLEEEEEAEETPKPTSCWDQSVVLTYIRLDSMIWGMSLLSGVFGANWLWLMLDAGLEASNICHNRPTLWWYHFVAPFITLIGALIVSPVNLTEIGAKTQEEEGGERRVSHLKLKSAHLVLAIVFGLAGIILCFYFLIQDWLPSRCNPPGVKLVVSTLCPLLSVILFKWVNIVVAQVKADSSQMDTQ